VQWCAYGREARRITGGEEDENGCYGNAQQHMHSKETRWITGWQRRRERTLWQCVVMHAWQGDEGNSRRVEAVGVDVVERHSSMCSRKGVRRTGWWEGSENRHFYEMQWYTCRREVGETTAEWTRQKWTLWRRSSVAHMRQGSERGNRMIDEVGLDNMARHSGTHAAESQ
jgi:hypothetical protein